MDERKIIRSLDELFIYAHQVACKEVTLCPIQLEGNFTLALRIEGASWDSRIDKRTAQYILALQAAFDNIMEEYAPDEASEKLLVKASVHEGSWQSEVDIESILQVLVGKMSGDQVFIAIAVTICAVLGYAMWSRYHDRKEAVELEQERTRQEEEQTIRTREQQETVRAAIDVLRVRADEAPEQYASYERPIRGLVKMLQPEDTITVGDTEDKIPAESAKKCGPRRLPRSEERVTYADGSYIVNSRRYDEGEIVLELEQNGVVIKGYLSLLDDHDKDVFMASLDAHEKDGELPFSMDLQLNVVHTLRKLKCAYIILEGEPRRKDCTPLDAILQSHTE